MPNLFVIGNGFDLKHGMATRFKDFRNYLYQNHPVSDSDILYPPKSICGPHGEDLQCDNELSRYIAYLLDNASRCNNTDSPTDWWNLEYLLGRLNLLECFSQVEPQYDKEGDRFYPWELEIAEDLCGDMALAISNITDFLSDWIHSIDIPKKPMKSFKDLTSPTNDLFFSFNYTKTLEKLYRCPENRVCHIHGTASDDPAFQIDDLILGHCGQKNYLMDPNVPYDMGSALQHIYNTLRKDTGNQISLHRGFFEKLSNTGVDTIYSSGFSFGEVDLPYIKKICSCVKTKNITWLLDDHDSPAECNVFMQKLCECGFLGIFGTVSIKEF